MTPPLVDRVTLNITGEHREQFAEALMDAFPAYAELQQMVQYRMDLNLATIAGENASLEIVVFKLIERAKANGHFLRLLAAARESRPGNPKLAVFAEQFNLAIQTSRQPQLERIIKQKSKFLDIAAWRERLGEIEGRVCRIEVATNVGSVYGTGFLVGPDLVLTNYHVVEAVIAGQGGPSAPQARAQKSDVRLLFDYKLMPGGQVNPGTPVGLREIVDYSPYDPVDMEPLPRSRDPHPENLDYALLRLETQGTKPFAARPIGSKPEPGAPSRGSIALPSVGQPLPLPPHAPMFIVQHPDTEPMKLALDEDAIIAVNGNNTRVTYKTNTLGGSSGSPCFNQDLELAALHHAGDPKYGPLYHPEFNEGIPITAILELLEKRQIKLR